MTATQTAQGMQVGAYPPGSNPEVAARSYIQQPAGRANGSIGRFYWIGVSFPSNWFIQAGYYDSAAGQANTCQTGFSDFVTILHNESFVNGYGTYNVQNCGLTGSHYFKIGLASAGANYTEWQAYMDDSPIGPALDFTGPGQPTTFTRYEVATVSEIANGQSQALNSSTAFPNVHYNPSFQFRSSGGTTWDNSEHGDATVSGPYYNCTWFSEQYISPSNIQKGKPTNLPYSGCYSNGDVLW